MLRQQFAHTPMYRTYKECKMYNIQKNTQKMKHLKLKTKILKNLICYHMTCINPKKSLSDDVSSLNLMILTDVLLYLFVLYRCRCTLGCRRSTTSISNSPRRRHQLGFAIKPIFSTSPSPVMAAGHNYQPSTTFRLQILNFKS